MPWKGTTMPRTVKLLKIRQAAEMLGVNPETLRRWDKSGKLKAIIISERGDRRYKREDIVRLVKKLADQ